MCFSIGTLLTISNKDVLNKVYLMLVVILSWFSLKVLLEVNNVVNRKLLFFQVLLEISQRAIMRIIPSMWLQGGTGRQSYYSGELLF